MKRCAVAAEPVRKPVDAERARRAANVKATSIKPAEPAEETEEWVVSYMDMVTVLMTVFLGMLALMGMDGRIANPTDKERADAAVVERVLEQPQPVAVVEPVSTAPQTAALTAPAPHAPAPASTAAPAPTPAAADAAMPPPKERELSPGARQWLAHLEAMGLPPEVDITTQDRKVAIVVRDRILFNSGSATLQPEALDLLHKLTPNLLALPGSITVEGHSDDVAIKTVRFPSNWELSAARAAAVVRALEAFGVPSHRLGALGLADSRPVTDDPARRSENRRVEIVIDTDADVAQSATR